MSHSWFRSWHGAPTDPKWLAIARKSGVVPGMVAAIVWALLDRASQSDDRGSISGYDADGLGCFFGLEADQVEAVIAAMRDKGILSGDRFSGWEKHQPCREDGSAERARAWRERSRTQPNAIERNRTLDTDTDTDTEKNKRDVVSAGAETSVDRSSKPKIRKKPAYSAEFNKFFDGFPGREGTSKAEAWEVWVTLPPEDQKAASDALSAFVAWCGKQKPDYRPLHACRYLKYRRWETLASTSTSPPVVQVPVLAGTEAFRAWERHNGKSSPTTTIRDPTTQAVIGTGWYFPTEFPQERAA